MQPIFHRLSMLCAGSLLLACATLQKPSLPTASAEESYLIGRSYHMALRPTQALAYYQAALRSQPAHVNARNGLAALYAEQGELDKAIPLWETLTAQASGVDSAFLFSNLGYAYLLKGAYSQAQTALERACLNDPLNARAWEHLGSALEKLGQHERAASMLRQANALRGHDIKSDYQVARTGPVPALDAALGSAATSGDQWARTEVSQIDGGMFVLRRVAPSPTVLPHAPANFAGNVLLEISNGNGVTGMARSVSREIGRGNTRVVRLTNQKGFSVQHTRVEYKSAFRMEAERLAGRYSGAEVVKVSEQGRADIRLVLGRDLLKPARPALAAVRKESANS